MAKSLPRMYTKDKNAKEQIRESDTESVASGDPMETADYEPNDSLVITKLRKKGAPSNTTTVGKGK